MNNPLEPDRLIAFAQALVRRPSLSGSEAAVVELVVDEMRALRFDRVWVDENGSAIGIIEGAQPGPTLLLDAHCDTVGIAEGSVWTFDPFGGDIEDGFLRGRGAADMKGALAAMMHGAAAVDRSRIAGQLAVSATVMEEVLEGVSLKTVMQQTQPDMVVVGEATKLNVNRGGRGRAEIHLETIGRPAHSSSPQEGINAVHQMIRVVEIVEELPMLHDVLIGSALCVLTDIISDPYPGYSVIPSRCRVTYDRRTLPGEQADDVLRAITSHPALKGIALKASIAQSEHPTYTGKTLCEDKFFAAWILDEQHPLVRSAILGLRAIGLDPRFGAYQFCTNAAYSAGVANVPTIGFGPAAEEDAHVANERVALQDLITASRGYRSIVETVLNAGANAAHKSEGSK